jgi:hypothetical protein
MRNYIVFKIPSKVHHLINVRVCVCACVRDVIWLYESSHKNKFPFVPYRHALFSTVTLYSVTGENFYGISEIGFGIYNKSLLTFKRTRSLYSVLYILKSFDD